MPASSDRAVTAADPTVLTPPPATPSTPAPRPSPSPVAGLTTHDVATSEIAHRLVPGRGPLLRAADPTDHRTGRLLERAWRSGRLVRLARRTYVSAQLWCSVPAWDRHSIAAAAFSLARPGPVVFTGLTGAHLRGLPVAVLPPTLQWRATTRGHRGRQPRTAQAVCAGLDHAVEVPSVPDQQARWGLPTLTGGTASTSNTNSTAEPVGVVLSTGVSLGPVLVDAMPSLALVLGAHHPFRQAVPPLDAVAARHPVPLQRWVSEAPAHVPAAAARARRRRAAVFADPRSESAGESLSRVLIEELGFAPPTALQHAVRDERGRQVARVDFWWERERLVGEFDGIGKYDLALHGGDDAARRRSIRRENEREVALQRVTSGIAHWTWADLRDPQRLARILTAFGVPRR